MGRIVTLLTDFGTQDVYGGVMKGVIAAVCPTAKIIDLTHQIPPQDLYAARFCLLNTVPYFPADAIHVVVVDPGVGTPRRGIVVETEVGLLVGPDNGVMSGLWQTYAVRQAVELTNRSYWRIHEPSTTFHGRDIFAPVAAHLARGEPLSNFGAAISPNRLLRLNLPPLVVEEERVEGVIQYIDHFGNAVTTIPSSALGAGCWQAAVHGYHLPLQTTYGAVSPDQPLALIGSHGWVEIAVNQGSAKQRLHLQVGDAVTVTVSG